MWPHWVSNTQWYTFILPLDPNILFWGRNFQPSSLLSLYSFFQSLHSLGFYPGVSHTFAWLAGDKVHKLNAVAHAWLNSWERIQMWPRSSTEPPSDVYRPFTFQTQLCQCMAETKPKASGAETQWTFSICTCFNGSWWHPVFCSLQSYGYNRSLCFLLVRIPAPLGNKKKKWSSSSERSIPKQSYHS